ncbi:J domain-containing protein [uncultured Hymenobacter sp.]|uniref:J domain-containing protein n=1 Tax=uncultured Hymenobacter sp. TaxID=170016 RepID=UPI0035CC1444
MEKADFAPPTPPAVPARQAAAAAPASPAQQAFRQAIIEVGNLQEQLRALRTEQAEARRRYWQQVGPAAAAVVAARRALYAPLEEALLLGYFSRAEEAQLKEVILANARMLEARFGEDEAAIITKYGPAAGAGRRPGPAASDAGPAADIPTPPTAADPAANPTSPPPERAAAAARARRLTKAQRAQQAAEAAARADQQQLAANAKTVYRQLARAHHPDLEPDPARQAARTAQMQRITAAYEAGDLYALLQLLAESAPAAAGEAAAEVLARYTQALRQQQVSLKKELNELKYGPQGFAGSSGKKREAELRQLKRALREEAAAVQHAGRLIREPAGLRQLLRELSAAGQDTV